MHSPSADEQFLRGAGVVDDPIHLKLHHALDDHDEFIDIVRMAFPQRSQLKPR